MISRFSTSRGRRPPIGDARTADNDLCVRDGPRRRLWGEGKARGRRWDGVDGRGRVERKLKRERREATARPACCVALSHGIPVTRRKLEAPGPGYLHKLPQAQRARV